MYDVEFFSPGEDLAPAFQVRQQVFVEEQKFSAASEFDKIDAISHHVVIFSQRQPIATARIFPSPEVKGQYNIGRIAVSKDYRGKGLGRKAVELLEEKGRQLGATTFWLSSQEGALGFYEKMGYRVVGEMEMDEHTPHYPVAKNAE